MDDARFDHLAKRFAVRLSRRRTLPALVAGLAGLGGLVPPPRAEARTRDPHRADCNGVGRKCGLGHPCCPGQGLICSRHRCRRQSCLLGANGLPCGEGRLCCGGVCGDVRTDPFNCGACNHACRPGERCLGGSCVSPCLGGLANCNGQCVDVLRDPANCGGCDQQCVAGQACSGGACVCRQRRETCVSAQACCQDAARAPLADAFDTAVSCAAFGTKPGGVGTLVCSNPPSGPYCCAEQGAVCTNDCDCCGDLLCLGEGGCGRCLATGKPCPLRCPGTGPCTLCCTGACNDSYCGEALPDFCVKYGYPCMAGLRCCQGVPCNGGLCRYP